MQSHHGPRLRSGILALTLLTLASCAGNAGRIAAPEPARPIDAARFYTGRWYEIARTPMRLTDGCVAGTTDYFHRPDGQLMEKDSCRMHSPKGKVRFFQGPVTILDPGANTKISVRYSLWGFIPVHRDYWMLDHGTNYDWFIVSDPDFQNLSLFTRTPRPAAATVQMLTLRAARLGYSTGRLEYPARFPPGAN